MRENLGHLNIFYEVAKYKSFTLAAQKLFITQPAVTFQIHSLERDLRVKLFNRIGKKIELTQAGKILFSYAEKIFNLAEVAGKEIRELLNASAGILEIGTPEAFSRIFIPQVVQKFNKKYPNVKICIDSGPSQKIVDNIINLKNDIAIVSRIPYPKEIRSIPFYKEEVLFIAPKNHKFCKFKKISIKDLDGEPLIMRDWGSGTHKLVLQEFRKENIYPFVKMESADIDTLIHLVYRGIGSSFMVKYAVINTIESGKIKSLSFSPKIYLNFDIIFHKDRKEICLAQEFLGILSDESEGVLEELEIFESFKQMKKS
ncbi:MAG: LysR family transcriptional regulator [Thermodesulfobacteriota bacterium]